MRHCKSTSSPNHDGQIAFRFELIMYNSYFILESKQTSTDAEIGARKERRWV